MRLPKQNKNGEFGHFQEKTVNKTHNEQNGTIYITPVRSYHAQLQMQLAMERRL